MLAVFLGISAVIIFISVFFIHKVVAFFKLELEIKAIFLAALLSFGMCIIIWPLERYFIIPYNVIIAGIVSTGAIIATIYNKKLLLHKMRKHELCKTADNEAATACESLSTEQDNPEKMFIDDVNYKEKREIAVCLPALVSDVSILHECSRSLEERNVKIKNSGDKLEQLRIEKRKADCETIKRLVARKNKEFVPVLPVKPPKRLTESQQKKILSHYNTAAKHKKYNLPVPIRQARVNNSNLKLSHEKKEQLTVFIDKLVSIDDIIGFIYDKNKENDFSGALYSLEKALERYYKSEYAPFICIEMNNIYKKFGAYDEAVNMLKKAYYLPVVKNNVQLQQNFKAQIHYLRRLQCILAEHNMATIPFDNIPESFLQQAQ
ncbi:hypothetical protein [Pectinatus sottacetonis]|uniref:hypothetical protein n=1 Tax=Pectinatus sottacetonis TaxID=1002795 RepID=UPI0018C6C941|nr:hypothetical protein [Pectinatus sottacetonis]